MVAAIAEGVGHKYSDSRAEQEFEVLFVLLAEATSQQDPPSARSGRTASSHRRGRAAM